MGHAALSLGGSSAREIAVGTQAIGGRGRGLHRPMFDGADNGPDRCCHPDGIRSSRVISSTARWDGGSPLQHSQISHHDRVHGRSQRHRMGRRPRSSHKRRAEIESLGPRRDASTLQRAKGRYVASGPPTGTSILRRGVFSNVLGLQFPATSSSRHNGLVANPCFARALHQTPYCSGSLLRRKLDRGRGPKDHDQNHPLDSSQGGTRCTGQGAPSDPRAFHLAD